MINYVGNCIDIIDWNSLILKLSNTEPGYVGPKHKIGDQLPGLDEVIDIWNQAGYKTLSEGGTVAWDMFLSGDQFDLDIVEKFANFIGMSKVESCWISRIWPGNFSPYHWDVNDEEVLLSTQPDKDRFHCHMSPPEFGHLFMIDDQCLYNQPQGSVYKWSSRKSWHAGTNCGLVPKYLFNMWGTI
jgi:hypothetical protein